jgi:hypothetical protein
MTVFAKLDGDGHVTELREIKQSDMRKCPHFIMVAEHYRTDGACRCNDPKHTEMAEWGYEWRDGLWQQPIEKDS